MRTPNLEEQRVLVRLWETAGKELERLRREKLRGMPSTGRKWMHCWIWVTTTLAHLAPPPA